MIPAGQIFIIGDSHIGLSEDSEKPICAWIDRFTTLQPRALYLCDNMGIDSIGVDAKRRDYVGENYFWWREYLSRVMAWYDINFRSLPPEPEDKQPIGS